MFPKVAFAALVTGIAASAAMADQYVAQLDAPMAKASAGLLENLKIVEIDAFTHDGTHYVVIEAPNEAYLEAYFYAMSRSPKALHTLGPDWNASGLSSSQLEQQLPILAFASCGFCSS